MSARSNTGKGSPQKRHARRPLKAVRERPPAPARDDLVEDVEVRGHIIDSLILPKILDCITGGGGTFRIKEIAIGQARTDPSHAVLEVRAESAGRLTRILAQIADHGAVPTSTADCQLVAADIPGTFPEGFYSWSKAAPRSASWTPGRACPIWSSRRMRP